MGAAAPPRRLNARGQGLVEYALIMTLIVVVAIASLTFFGSSVSGMLTWIGTSV
jgi:Flp pilus assembly pilin Flp